VLEEALCGDAERGILLETLHEELAQQLQGSVSEVIGSGVYTYRRGTAGYGWMLIVDNSKQGLHGLQLVVGRLSFNQLDNRASQTPYV
jgi:hypothetical protein